MIAKTQTLRRTSGVDRHTNLPVYELRLTNDRGGGYRLEVWQLPSPASPQLTAPQYIASLKGASLRLLESRLIKRLARSEIRLGSVKTGREKNWDLDEDQALHLGLLFRALSPMRNLDRIRQVADGIEDLTPEEAAYWLGMAMHRKNPRRVLAALRMLLTTR